MPLGCPGTHVKVADGITFGMESLANKALTLANAKSEAGGKAMAEAFKAFAKNQCAAPCISIPNIRIVRSKSFLIPIDEDNTLFVALGYAVWELDVICINPNAGGGGGGGVPLIPGLNPKPLPGDIAPVHGGSRTKKGGKKKKKR